MHKLSSLGRSVVRQSGPKPPSSRVLIALSWWTPRHVLVAVIAAFFIAILIGIPSVLIPNPLFAREIPPVWWNYPVWLLTAALSGLLVATYLTPEDTRSAQTPSRMGIAGGALTWFAVGCPVCNKIVLLALGYSGALAWFAPAQAYLALVGLALTSIALYARLRGQVACPVPASRKEDIQ